MSKHMKNLLLHFLLIFAVATILGLVYVHQHPGLRLVALDVVRLSFLTAATATICLAITDAITGRR